MAKRVVLIDGSWLIFRAFYAIPSSFRTSSGVPTNATYGFATMFRKLLAGKEPDFGAVVFDPPGATFRDEKYPAYKAERPAMEDDLKAQLPWIDKVVEAHDFPMLRIAGYEADDVIGTLATQADAAGYEVFMVTGDKDFAQLVTDRVKMWDTMKDVVYDPELVRKKWGVPPSQIVDLLALMGDKIDNIPGVPGIGIKTAKKLLDAYGNLEGVYEHIEDQKGKRRENLETYREDAFLSQDLATIKRDVPLEVGLDDIAVSLPDGSASNDLFGELEFYSLLARDVAAEKALVEDAEYTICRTVEEVRAQVTALPADEPVALHLQVQNEDEPPRFGGLAGVAVASAPGVAFYVPLDAGDDGLGENAGLDALASWLGDADRPKVAHGAKLAWRELRRRGVALEGVIGDTMLGSFLVNPTRLIPHDLGKVVKEYLQRVPPVAKSVVGSGKKQKRFGEVPASEAGGYACRMAHAVIELWPLIAARLEDESQTAHLLEHELPLSWVLGQMELDGILVDRDDLAALGKEFRGTLEGIESRIHELAGKTFNIKSTKQLGTVLFDEMGLPVIKRTKTGYSTAQGVLEKLSEQGHGIAGEILEHRKLAKLINTYTDVLQAAIDPETGRVHATFQQTVGATGRLISTDPDLQRTPVKTDEGKRIRRAFVAPEGRSVMSADWSQIELRLLAHFTRDARLVDAFSKGLDVHARTAAELFDIAVDEVSREQRNTGKLVNFSTIYGQGATALGQILGIPRKEAKAYIERFFDIFADVRSWLDKQVETAHECGWVETIAGRRRYIPELTSNNFMDRQYGERVAANTPIQGSAADICKDVMLEIDRRFRAEGVQARMLVQIHDELVFEVPDEDVSSVEAIVRDVMENHIELSVPLVVDVGVGANWDEAHS